MDYIPSDILSFFEFDGCINYKSWKKERNKLIQRVGKILSFYDDDRITNLYLNHEEIIKKNILNERFKTQMAVLMSISVLSVFQRDYPISPNCLTCMLTYIMSSNQEIVLATAKTVYWVGSCSRTLSDVIFEIEDRAVAIFQEMKARYYFNATILLWKTLKLQNLSDLIVNENIMGIVLSIAMENVSLISIKATKIVVNLYESASSYHPNRLFGTALYTIINRRDIFGCFQLVYLTSYFNNDKSVSEEHVKSIIDAVTSFGYLSNEDVSTYTIKLIIAISRKYGSLFNQSSIKMIFFMVVSRPILSQYFEELVKFFSPFTPMKEIYDHVMEAVIKDRQFFYINILLDYSKLNLPPQNLFLDSYPTISYVQCLKKYNNLSNDLKSHLLSYVAIGLKQKATVEQTKCSLRIIMYLHKKLFETPKSAVEIITHLVTHTEEDVLASFIKTLDHLSVDESKVLLLSLGLYCPIKSIRYKALKRIDCKTQNQIFLQTLSDSSYKIKKLGIKMIYSMFDSNPFEFGSHIITFAERNISHMYCCTNIKVSCKIASILFQISQNFSNLLRTFFDSFLKIVADFVPEKTIEIAAYQKDVVFASKIINDNNRSNENKSQYLYIPNAESLYNKRSCDLIKMLSFYAPIPADQLDTLLNIFSNIISDEKSVLVLNCALDSLYSIISASEISINLRSKSPKMVDILIKRICSCKSKSTRVSILKLLGSSIDIIPSATNSRDEYSLLDIQSPSFYTDQVLTILSNDFFAPSIPLYESCILVFEIDPKNSSKFAQKLIPSILSFISNTTFSNRVIVFSYLEVIVSKCQNEIVPFFEQISQILNDNIYETSCIKFGAVCAFQLKYVKSNSLGSLYQKCLKNLGSNDRNYLKYLLKFISFCVLFQNQPFELFLISLENFLLQIDSVSIERGKIIIKALITIIQSIRCVQFQSRLVILCYRFPQSNHLGQLVSTLVEYLDLPRKNARKVFNSDIGTPRIRNPSIKRTIMNVPSKSELTIFRDIKRPNDENIEKWIGDLITGVISQSPSDPVRSCKGILSIMSNPKNSIFPIAFLSCWKVASDAHRKSFSAIMEELFYGSISIDPVFFQIAEILDRAQIPFLISDHIIAQHSCFRPQSLYYFQRYHSIEQSKISLELLMGQNLEMGRIPSATSLLKKIQGSNAGSWNQSMGEYSKALELFKQSNDICNMVQCYAHLEQWEEIRQYDHLFNSFTQNGQGMCAATFAEAYMHLGDIEKAREYIRYLPEDSGVSDMISKAKFYIKTQDYQKAREQIEESFSNLQLNSILLQSGDYYIISKLLTKCQKLVELSEVINILDGSPALRSERVKNQWQRRITFNRDSESWIELINIRSLLNIDTTSESAFLIVSALRKERRFDLAELYFQRFFALKNDFNSQFGLAKLRWASGKRQVAINILSNIVKSYECRSPEAFQSVFLSANAEGRRAIESCVEPNDLQSIFEESSTKAFNYFKEHISMIPNEKISKLFRTYANYMWLSQPDKGLLCKDVSDYYYQSTQYNQIDYKSWIGWAHVNVYMMNCNVADSDKYLLDACTGFLRATQINSSNSLEYLCQLFSILFRVHDSKIISHDLVSRITSLSPDIIFQIIPQLAAQITHPDKLLRSIIMSIFSSFGQVHFEPLFYPLNVFLKSDNPEKASGANDILLSLKAHHNDMYNDCNLLANGLLKSAVSWFEEWITILTNASRNPLKVEEYLLNSLQRFKTPENQFDLLFQKYHGPDIENFEFLIKTKQLNVLSKSMDKLFKELMERVNKLQLIFLSKTCEELASKRGFSVHIPGSYQIHGSIPNLHHIEPAMEVLGTQQHPRCVTMVDNNAQKYKFLLKGNDDVRLDERIMQFFKLINSLLNRSTKSGIGSQIVNYAIVPLAPKAGLISWVMGADTLHQIIIEHRDYHKISQSIEMEILNPLIPNIFSYLNSLQKFEFYGEVESNTKANEVREMMWVRSPNSAAWLSRSTTFCTTTALMSMVGYIIGLGDRHPSNIMIHRETGRIIHIDFNDSFEVNLKRSNYPEKVPFRLTRVFINALDGGNIDGLFRHHCEDVMRLLRENQGSISALFEIFVYDPLSERADVTDRMREKLSGHDSFFDQNPETEKTAEEQVDLLIEVAANPLNYVSHYVGWCPFW